MCAFVYLAKVGSRRFVLGLNSFQQECYSSFPASWRSLAHQGVCALDTVLVLTHMRSCLCTAIQRMNLYK